MVRMERKEWLTPWEQGFDAGVAGKTEADNPFPYVDGSPYEGPTEYEQWSEGLVSGKLRKLRDDYATLEAERDELAASLRAVDVELDTLILIVRETGPRTVEAHLQGAKHILDGPVPECRVCAEVKSQCAEAIAEGEKGPQSPMIIATVETCRKISAVIARHAADEGWGHESV